MNKSAVVENMSRVKEFDMTLGVHQSNNDKLNWEKNVFQKIFTKHKSAQRIF